MQQTNQITKLTIAEPEQFVRFFKFYEKHNDNPEITLNFEKDKLSFREMNLSNIWCSSQIATDACVRNAKKELRRKNVFRIIQAG